MKRYIDRFFNYRYHGLRSDSRGIAISVDPHPTSSAVFILIQTPIPRIYREIREIIAYTVCTQFPPKNRHPTSTTVEFRFNHLTADFFIYPAPSPESARAD